MEFAYEWHRGGFDSAVRGVFFADEVEYLAGEYIREPLLPLSQKRKTILKGGTLEKLV